MESDRSGLGKDKGKKLYFLHFIYLFSSISVYLCESVAKIFFAGRVICQPMSKAIDTHKDNNGKLPTRR
jgi:hypothetical protein